MSDIISDDFKSSSVLIILQITIDNLPADANAKLIKQVNGTFEFVITNDAGKTETFTADLKKDGSVIRGRGASKPDVIMSASDADFFRFASGRIPGKFFQSG